MKKVLAVVIVLLLIASPVFAAAGDIYKSDKTFFMSAMDFLSDVKAVEEYVNNPENYLTELGDGLLYKAEDIAKAFQKNPMGYQEDLKSSGKGVSPKPVEEELKVSEINFRSGNSAEVSLSREATFEEVKKLSVMPEGEFDTFEGKKKEVTVNFKAALRDEEEVSIGAFKKVYKKKVMKVVDFKLSARGTFAKVSLSEEAELEELTKIKSKPEGVFARVEGKIATLKFNEQLKEGQEVEIEGISKRFKKTVHKKFDLGAMPYDHETEGFIVRLKNRKMEIIDGELEYDAFLERAYIYFEDSFRIKSNYPESGKLGIDGDLFYIHLHQGHNKKYDDIYIYPGQVSKPISFEPEEMRLDISPYLLPDTDTKFTRATPISEDPLYSKGNTTERCKMAEGTKVTVQVTMDSTTITIFEKEYEAKENLEEFKTDLEALRFRGKWIYGDFTQIPGTGGSKTEVKFKINEELIEYKPVLTVVEGVGATDNCLGNGKAEVKGAQLANITFVGRGGRKLKVGGEYLSHKIVIKEDGVKIFEGFLETLGPAHDNWITKEMWDKLNTDPRIKFSGEYNGSGGEPVPNPNTLKIEFDSGFKGDMSFEFVLPWK